MMPLESEPADDYIFQAKTLIRPLETNGYGFRIAAGTVRHPAVSPGPNLFGNSYIYVPYSASFADDQFVVHVNGGRLKERTTAKIWQPGAWVLNGMLTSA
jgi:hypothetical protein